MARGERVDRVTLLERISDLEHLLHQASNRAWRRGQSVEHWKGLYRETRAENARLRAELDRANRRADWATRVGSAPIGIRGIGACTDCGGPCDNRYRRCNKCARYHRMVRS